MAWGIPYPEGRPAITNSTWFWKAPSMYIAHQVTGGNRYLCQPPSIIACWLWFQSSFTRPPIHSFFHPFSFWSKKKNHEIIMIFFFTFPWFVKGSRMLICNYFFLQFLTALEVAAPLRVWERMDSLPTYFISYYNACKWLPLVWSETSPFALLLIGLSLV